MLENVLARIPLFSVMSEADIADLANHTYTRIYEENTIVINEGDISDSLYVVLSGNVRVFVSDKQGKEITLKTLEHGEYFGELSLLDDAHRSASVRTIEHSMLAVICKSEFIKYLHKKPDIAVKLCIELSRRLRSATERLKDVAVRSDREELT